MSGDTYRENSGQSNRFSRRGKRQAVVCIDREYVTDSLFDLLCEQKSGGGRRNAVQAALHARGECRCARRRPVRGGVLLRLGDGLAFGCALWVRYIILKILVGPRSCEDVQCPKSRCQAGLRRGYPLDASRRPQLLHVELQYTIQGPTPKLGAKHLPATEANKVTPVNFIEETRMTSVAGGKRG